MGHRLTQRIYTCDKCGITPKEGENMWRMGTEVWCEDCCNNEDDETDSQATQADPDTAVSPCAPEYPSSSGFYGQY